MKFKDEKSLEVFDIQENHLFAPGDIYWEKSSGKKIRVIKYGCPIEKNFLKKFKNLKYNNLVNNGLIKELSTILRSLKLATLMPDKIKARKNLLQFLTRYYRNEGNSSNILDFIIAFKKEFYSLPSRVEEKLLNASHELFKRGLLLGSLRVSYSLLMGHFDYSFLKDVYHSGPIVSFFLIKHGISTEELDEVENYIKGHYNESFLKYLKNIDFSLDDDLKDFYKNPYSKHLITLNFEKVNGKGVPYGIHSEEITDIESIFIFTANSIPLKGLDSKEGDGEKFFKNIEQSVHNDFFHLRLKKVIEGLWNNAQEEAS